VLIVLRGEKDSVSFGPGSSRRGIILLKGQKIAARSKEIFVTKEREACFLSPTSFARHVHLTTQPKEDFDVRTMVVFFFVDYK